jgi:hypothetical protein
MSRASIARLAYFNQKPSPYYCKTRQNRRVTGYPAELCAVARFARGKSRAGVSREPPALE